MGDSVNKNPVLATEGKVYLDGVRIADATKI